MWIFYHFIFPITIIHILLYFIDILLPYFNFSSYIILIFDNNIGLIPFYFALIILIIIYILTQNF